MATVNLSWTVEGLHDGIRVERSFMNGGIPHKDYLDTLPPGVTEFEDDFSISELAAHYEVIPNDLNLLTYTLTTFRGDKEKSTVVPVPVVDTDPEWILNGFWPEYTNQMESVSTPILKSLFSAAIDTSIYGENMKNLPIFFADTGNITYALQPSSADGDPYGEHFDFTQLHNLNFTRILNSQINNSESAPLMTDVIIGNLENPFENESYLLEIYPITDYSNFDPAPFDLENNQPHYYFLSAPYVSENQSENSTISGMAIDVYNNYEGVKEAQTIPWTPSMKGVYVYATAVALAGGVPKRPE